MFKMKVNFHFPEIIPIGKLELRKPRENNNGVEIKEVNGYKLDWNKCDKRREDDFYRWKNKCWPDTNLMFIPTIPPEYKWVENLKFIIPDPYLHEIRRNTLRAVDEWNIRRAFDTIISETCLAPAVEHIFVAFVLLADCIYDENTYYYDRNRHPYSNILAYKFWMFQTGNGMVWPHSHGNDIDQYLNNKSEEPYVKEWAEKCVNWKVAATKHLELLRDKCTPPSPTLSSK